jgi:hypothetical protein
MYKIQAYLGKLLLLSTIFVVLVGSETLYQMMDSYIDKAVCLESEDIEDDFEDEIKLKTFFENESLILLSVLRKNYESVFHFNEDLTLDDYSTIFGPPPDKA